MPMSLAASKSFVVLLCASVVFAKDAGSQEPTTRVSLTAGVATDQRGVRSNAVTVAPSIYLEPSNYLSLQLGASATRFATETWSLGAGGSLSGRDPVGRLGAMTLNASVSASRLQGPTSASFLQAELMPALELRVRRLALFGGVRAATGFASEDTRPGGLPLGSRPSATSATRTGAGPVFGGVVTIDAAAGRLDLGAREDRLRITSEEIRDRSVNATLSHGRVTMAATAGMRGSSSERVSFGSMAFSVAVGSGASIDIAAGRYPSNRVIGTPGGNFLNAGLSLRLGGARASPPMVTNASPLERGWTRLAIRAPDANRVDVAGDFNEWTPTPARHAANGVWYADLKIPPGQYRYAFRVNGIEWRVPDGATAVEDEFGGKSAWLTVREAGSR